MVDFDFPALKTARESLIAAQDELASIFSEAGPDLDMDKIKSISGDSKTKRDAIQALNAKIDERAVVFEDLEAIRGIAVKRRKNGEKGDDGVIESGTEHGQPSAGSLKSSFGELFVKSDAYLKKVGSSGPEAHLDIELKTLFQTSAGWLPETTRTGRLVDFATRPIQIIDLIPPNVTAQAAVVYMEETTFTNTAAEVAEGGTYAEATLVLTEQTSNVRKVGVWLPMTDEQLEDEQQAIGYVNNRLPFMLRQRLDSQLLVGNGTPPNLRGILNVAGIQTQAKGADPIPDAVYKGMVKVRVTGRALPSAVVFHPTDWQSVRLLRTADGLYIWGSPSDSAPLRIWGVPVVESDAITLGTALVGDYLNFSELATRRGVDVQVTNSHSTFFIEGKQAVRADVRVAFVVYRPAAFCTVTGL